jgi:hypothetical protein
VHAYDPKTCSPATRLPFPPHPQSKHPPPRSPTTRPGPARPGPAQYGFPDSWTPGLPDWTLHADESFRTVRMASGQSWTVEKGHI